ncbi:hypothetical protein SteCoe_8698 [Stentor coeruleus]|uniref:Dickkopf N-terminal cysteine-rich domain-containing protein n=1 Tax=Stentor coeruleus TaxID=5963 RepID=A0A1R2CJL5_9CILI|nr:hypothetical protein SteCoe_8698 [Stentor coeruleus]
MFYLLFIAHIAKGLESSSCKLLECSKGPTQGNCIEDQGDKILISPCIDGYICEKSQFDEFGTWKNTTCEQDITATTLCKVPDGSLYTGRKCCVSPNCNSTQCTNDRCEGISEGSECIDDEQCYPGYYCKENSDSGIKICSAAETEMCSRDNQCPIGYGCNNGYCMQFHTVEVARFVERDIFCTTNFSYGGRCDYIRAFSKNAELTGDLGCDIGVNCEYLTGVESLIYETFPCLCAGISGAKGGYCGLYAEKSMEASNYFKALVYDTSSCSGYYSHTDDYEILYECGSITYETYEYAKSMISRYNYYNLYVSHALDHCSRPLGLFDPWYDQTTFSYAMYVTTYFAIVLGVY